MNYSAWYEENYPYLTAQGLWLRGQEINRLPLTAISERDFKVLFIRLSTYFDTGYSFTHQILYQIAARLPGVYADLAFLPPANDAKVMQASKVPWLLGTQSKLGPGAFDVLGFSNSIVQELINLPSFLKHSDIPLKKSARIERSDLPIIIMGGANAHYSSAIWTADPMVDGIYVGESDEGLRKIITICQTHKASNSNKVETLKALEEVQGFIQPDAPRATRKYFIPKLAESEALEAGPVYYLADQLGNSHLQISEGCPCFCSFCAESWDRKPYRERRAEKLLEIAKNLKAGMGLDEIDIYSFNFNMHSDLYQLIWDLVPHFRRIGLKSQRFDLLAHDPQMIEFQHVIEKASITCGLEGISPRLRKYLHKNLETEQLHDSLSAIFKSKARELKVFLIATGLEQQQDFLALEDLIAHIRQIHSATHAGTRVIFSMTPLVRFPWTPLEFEDAPSMASYAAILKEVEERVLKADFQFRASADLPEYWVSQVLVRAANPLIADALIAAVENSGFVYYRSISENFRQLFEKQLISKGVAISDCLKGFTLEESQKKPWAQIATGVHRNFLWEEVQRARSYKEIDYCLGREWVKAQCFRCGGCPSKFHIRDIVLAKQKREYNLIQFKTRVKEARESRKIVPFILNVGPLGRGVPRKMLAVALARALMKTDSQLIPGYQGFKDSTFSQVDQAVWLQGLEQYNLLWKDTELNLLLSKLKQTEFIQQVNLMLEGWGELLGLGNSEFEAREIKIDSPVAFTGDEYLKLKGLKFTVHKDSSTSKIYIFSKDCLKKALFSEIKLDVLDLKFILRAKIGKKLNIQEFLKASFSANGKAEWYKAICTITAANATATAQITSDFIYDLSVDQTLI